MKEGTRRRGGTLHGAGEKSSLLREYGCYRDRPGWVPGLPPAKSGPGIGSFLPDFNSDGARSLFLLGNMWAP